MNNLKNLKELCAASEMKLTDIKKHKEVLDGQIVNYQSQVGRITNKTVAKTVSDQIEKLKKAYDVADAEYKALELKWFDLLCQIDGIENQPSNAAGPKVK